MPTTRTGSTSKQSSTKAYASNDDIMAVLKAFKVEICSSNKALSDSLTTQFNELKIELQRVSTQVFEFKTLYTFLHGEVEVLKGKIACLESSHTPEQS